MLKIKNLIPLIILVTVLVPKTSLADREDLNPRGSGSTSNSIGALTTAPVVTSAAKNPLLIEQIDQAKKILATSSLNYSLVPQYKNTTTTTGKGKKKKTITKKQLTGYVLDRKDIALAILNPVTNQIEVTKGIQTDRDFNFPDINYKIERVRFNGVNTRFKVVNPAGGKVLALKYLITPTESGSKKNITSSLYEAIYVPYSQDLQTPEVSKYGEDYLTRVMNEVYNQLQNYPSQSVAGKTITEAIHPALVKALIYAEHMDTSEFLNNSDTQYLIGKVNMLFAGNGPDTFKYSVSSAGAAGITQFMPGTYKSLAARHTKANLITDFKDGMRNHVNAVKATYLLLDDYIAAVKARASVYFIPGHAFNYGAAAYNGGTVRVARAAKTFGTYWDQHQEDEENSLRNETVNYVKKVQRLIQVFNDQTTRS